MRLYRRETLGWGLRPQHRPNELVEAFTTMARGRPGVLALPAAPFRAFHGGTLALAVGD